jgi:N-acetyltransferase
MFFWNRFLPRIWMGLCEFGLDKELWRWTTTSLSTREDMIEFVETALKSEQEGTARPFATISRESGRVIGSTRFGNIDFENRHVEIGWTWICVPWQRTVANTEAKYLLLRHAFDILGCIRVEFKTDSLNECSRRALLRIGAKERRHPAQSYDRPGWPLSPQRLFQCD